MTYTSTLDKFTKDKNGKWTILQPPNVPIILWAVFKALAYYTGSSTLKIGFEFLSVSFLFVWAYLELISGANYFRKILGGVVLLAIIYSHF